MQAILEVQAFPADMELFPAADDEQFTTVALPTVANSTDCEHGLASRVTENPEAKNRVLIDVDIGQKAIREDCLHPPQAHAGDFCGLADFVRVPDHPLGARTMLTQTLLALSWWHFGGGLPTLRPGGFEVPVGEVRR